MASVRAGEQDESAPLIVVVDDDPNTARWAHDVLSLIGGYRVRVAESATDALSLVVSERPALVLTDLRMPGVDGCELISILRESHPSVSVAVLTAETRAPVGVPALRKPVRVDELLRFVARCLRGLASAPAGARG